jgi:mono/diheme cytochrome c family protein
MRGWLSGLGVGILLAAGLADGRRPVQAAVSRERLDAGAKLFHDRGCVFCHGEDLNGTEKAPYLNSIGRQWKREQIEKQVREGGGGMPAFGEILPGDEVETLVDFLGSRRKPVPKGWKPWGELTASPKEQGSR